MKGTAMQHEQLEAYPRSTMEVLEQLRAVHEEEYRKAVDALDALSDDAKIAKRYEKAAEKVDEARDLLHSIDHAIMELRGMDAPMAATLERLGAENVSIEFAQGEVEDEDEDEFDPASIIKYDGHVIAEMPVEITAPVVDAVPELHVLWPGAEEAIVLAVGPLTRFGELVANFLNAHPDADFLAKYEVADAATGTVCDAREVISVGDYGREFIISVAKKVDV